MSNHRIILIISQEGSVIDKEVKYGALWATINIAEYLSKCNNYKIYLAGLSSHYRSPITEKKNNIYYLLASNEKDLKKHIKDTVKNIYTLIQISRLDYIRTVKAYKHIIYHHNPNKVYFRFVSGVGIINFFKIPIICVSNSSGNDQLSYGINEELVKVVPNGYDANIFQPNKKENRNLHSIIFAGSIIDYKGIDIALNAFTIIKSHYPDAVFKICGLSYPLINFQPNYLDRQWLDQDSFLVWEKIELDISGVKYFGELSQTKLAEQFQKTSILITPSRIRETFGLVSLEAQACGCIPLLPNKGGFPETLQNGKTGYLYEENTPAKIADIIIHLWEKELPSEQQRTEAQIWVQGSFSWEKTGAHFLEILENTSQTKMQFLFNEFTLLILAFYQYFYHKVKCMFSLYINSIKNSK